MTSAAPAFSTRYFGVLVPGMRTTCWPWEDGSRHGMLCARSVRRPYGQLNVTAVARTPRRDGRIAYFVPDLAMELSCESQLRGVP
jgi:hypothetical protein